jgi:hypothetical protein
MKEYVNELDKLPVKERYAGFAVLMEDLRVATAENFDKALYLLQCFAELPPDFISYEVLRELDLMTGFVPSTSWLQVVFAFLSRRLFFVKATKPFGVVEALQSLSFISTVEENTIVGVRMHRQVQELVRSYQVHGKSAGHYSSNRREGIRNHIVSKLINIIPADKPNVSKDFVKKWGSLIRWEVEIILSASKASIPPTSVPLPKNSPSSDKQFLFLYINALRQFIPAPDQCNEMLERFQGSSILTDNKNSNVNYHTKLHLEVLDHCAMLQMHFQMLLVSRNMPRN